MPLDGPFYGRRDGSKYQYQRGEHRLAAPLGRASGATLVDKSKHYVLNTEAGTYRVTGGSTVFANTATIVAESITAPSENSVILPQPTSPPIAEAPIRARTTDAAFDPSKVAGAIILSPAFKLVFLSVLAITALAGFAQILMASFWTTPTDLQQNVFSAMGFAWKTGFGAIVGLLGGKTIN